jgi:phosphatidylglycerol:prolipoprotein diacylglycerol transferase
MYPILGYIWDIPVKSYWILNFFGIIAGFTLLFINIRPFEKIKKFRTLLFAVFIFIPFFLGARGGNIAEQFIGGSRACAAGGLFGAESLWWGIILSTVVSFPAAFFLKLNNWETADYFAISISLGGVFARLACLFNGCCFGNPCPPNTPFALYFPPGTYAGSVFPNQDLYPAQLYSSLSWLVIFLVLIYMKDRRSFNGELILVMTILFSIFTFSIDFIRYHETIRIISVSQIWSILVFISSLTLFLIFKKTGFQRISRYEIIQKNIK